MKSEFVGVDKVQTLTKDSSFEDIIAGVKATQNYLIMTQEEYDSMSSHDPNTLYFITE